MKELWDKYKAWIIGLVIILAAGCGVLIYFSILNKGKQQGTASVLSNIANPANDDPYTDSEKLKIRSYTTRIEDSMHWYKAFWQDTDLYDTIVSETSRVMVGCYEQYKLDTGNDLVSDLQNFVNINPDNNDNMKRFAESLTNALNQ